MRKNTFIVLLIFLVFFVISFLTNILGPIVPELVRDFDLSLGLAGFLPFAFFVAYGVMSIPAGLVVERVGEKKVLLWAFMISFAGAFLFAVMPGFGIALLSLFLIGVGMSMLQVVINPLLRVAGGESKFAFNSVMAQLFFGGASFLSPLLYSYLVNNVHSSKSDFFLDSLNSVVPQNLKWISLYWVFAVISILMVLVIGVVRFPKVELRDDEKVDVGNSFSELAVNRQVWLFFFGIFCYVGTEQGIANWISQFLQTYHGADPGTTGATVISNFWGLLTIGCLLGLLLLKIFDSRHVLILFTSGAVLSLLAALFGSLETALIAFPAAGFFASVMYSVIFSLALNSVPQHHGTFSGILCAGICGGAVVPLIVGALGEAFGLKLAMVFLLVPLGYILSIGVWARPLVTNARIGKRRELIGNKA